MDFGLSADANRDRTAFQKVPLRLGRNPVDKTGTARFCRIAAEVAGDQFQKPVPRGRRKR